MTSVLKNKEDQHLAQIARETVLKFAPKWLFKSNANHYEAQLPQGQLIRLHGGGRADVYLFIHEKKRYCLKWFHDNRLITTLRNGLGLSKAWYSYKISKRLQQLNIPAPRILAVVQPKRFATPLLIMEMLEDSQQLNLLLEDWKSQASDLCQNPRFSQLAENVGTFTHNLHQNNVLHRDFSPRNILVHEKNNTFEFCLIDLEDVYFGKGVKKNLLHFNARLPRYLDQPECTFFLEHFHRTYPGSQP